MQEPTHEPTVDLNALLPDDLILTGAELLDLGDIGACELVEGRLLIMTPPGVEHGRLEARLVRYLDTFVEERQLGWVLCGETGIYIRRNPDTVRGMDIAVISKERLPTIPTSGYLEAVPELIVEILSPGDRWENFDHKLQDYFSIGVDQVWVVHPRLKAVYVYYTADQRTVLGSDATLAGAGILAGFSVAVRALF